jgi:hypothetical protein
MYQHGNYAHDTMQDKEQLMLLSNQDKYLVKEEVAERYIIFSPWRGKWDMKLIQV